MVINNSFLSVCHRDPGRVITEVQSSIDLTPFASGKQVDFKKA